MKKQYGNRCLVLYVDTCIWKIGAWYILYLTAQTDKVDLSQVMYGIIVALL